MIATPHVQYTLTRKGRQTALIQKIMSETIKATQLPIDEAQEYLKQVAADAAIQLLQMDRDYIEAYKRVMKGK